MHINCDCYLNGCCIPGSKTGWLSIPGWRCYSPCGSLQIGILDVVPCQIYAFIELLTEPVQSIKCYIKVSTSSLELPRSVAYPETPCGWGMSSFVASGDTERLFVSTVLENHSMLIVVHCDILWRLYLYFSNGVVYYAFSWCAYLPLAYSVPLLEQLLVSEKMTSPSFVVYFL